MSATTRNAPLTLATRAHAELRMSDAEREQCRNIVVPDGEPPSRAQSTCQIPVRIGIFFDGTNNNRDRDEDDRAHSNVVRLFNMHPSMDGAGALQRLGHYSIYIPGVGTRFEENAEFKESQDGKAAAKGGQARILFGVIQVFNSIHRAFSNQAPLFSKQEVESELKRYAQEVEMVGNLSQGDRYERPRPTRNQWLKEFNRDIGKRISTARKDAPPLPYVPEVFVSVFGFSRGAAQAAAFCHWLHAAMPNGQVAGIPVRLGFAGLFDCVASVGIADSARRVAPFAGVMDGHFAWASEILSPLPMVAKVVHMVAAHEQRMNFPLTRVKASDLTELVYPGVHSDVGGGYGLSAQGRTDQKIQVQLKSDHQHSSLSLGHITRIEDNAGRKDARGEGFELRSDGHGVLRAKDGLLISTEARPNAQAHAKDMGETSTRLQQAQEQHAALGDLAKQHLAQETADQSQVAQDLQTQNRDIQGGQGRSSLQSMHGASGAQGQTGTSNTAASFPELATPHIALASPSGIASTTPGSSHQHSGQHHAITSGGHTSISTARSLLISAREALRLFAYKCGIQLVSAENNVEIQALQTSVHLLAKMDITHTANRITLTAKESVTINGGSSYTVWNAGGIRSGTTGSHTVHAGDFGLPGAKSVPVAMPGLPYVPENTPKQYSTRLNVIGLTGVDSASKRVAAELSFRAYSAKGELVARGTVDSKGYTSPVFTDKPEKLRFVLGDGDWGKSVDIVHT